jgi:hypothetical protein
MASASIVEQPQIGSLAKIIWLKISIIVHLKALNAAHLKSSQSIATDNHLERENKSIFFSHLERGTKSTLRT